MAMGADKSILVEVDAGAYETIQPLHVAKILAKIAEENKIDLILLGKQVMMVKRISRAAIYRTRWKCRALFSNTDDTHTYTRMQPHVHWTGGSAGHFTITLTHVLVHASTHPSTAQGGNMGHFAVTLTTHTYTHVYACNMCIGQEGVQGTLTQITRLYTLAHMYIGQVGVQGTLMLTTHL